MGGQFDYWGLWLDSEFGQGQCCESCTTFKNYVQLSVQKDFVIRNIEVWAVGEKPVKDEVRLFSVNILVEILIEILQCMRETSDPFWTGILRKKQYWKWSARKWLPMVIETSHAIEMLLKCSTAWICWTHQERFWQEQNSSWSIEHWIGAFHFLMTFHVQVAHLIRIILQILRRNSFNEKLNQIDALHFINFSLKMQHSFSRICCVTWPLFIQKWNWTKQSKFEMKSFQINAKIFSFLIFMSKFNVLINNCVFAKKFNTKMCTLILVARFLKIISQQVFS